MTQQTQRELRQLDLMAARLEAYRHDRLSLGPLIDDLDALWNELTMVQGAWREELRGHWWTLEQVYAVALDRGYASLPDDHRVLIDEAVNALGFLVDDARSRLRVAERGDYSTPTNKE